MTCRGLSTIPRDTQGVAFRVPGGVGRPTACAGVVPAQALPPCVGAPLSAAPSLAGSIPARLPLPFMERRLSDGTVSLVPDESTDEGRAAWAEWWAEQDAIAAQ